jgi:succinate dehydrogenase / fumarate reductase membrane anchor subunit
MQKPDHLVNPLAKAQGLGSAHHGAEHWLQERVTSILLIPLMLWLVWSVTHMTAWDYATVTAWLAKPVNAVLMIVSILASFHHAVGGMQVVYEDYIHARSLRMIKITGMKVFFAIAAIACVFAILKIAFGS